MNLKSLFRTGAASAFILVLGLLLPGCSKEDKIAGHLDKADKAFARRDFEVAKIEYINVIRLQTTNHFARLRLGKILFEQGQVADAFQFLSKARDQYPNDIELHTHLAVIYSSTPGETNRIAFHRELEEALRLDPTNETALVLLGTATRTPEELTASEARLASLRAARGDHPLYHLVDATFAITRNDLPRAEEHFKKVLELTPDSAIAHQLYANFFALQGRRAETETHLKRAYELSAPHAPARLAWGRFLFGSGRLDEARSVLDDLNAKAPERTAGWVARAELALAERKPDDAERALTTASAQAPFDVDVLRTIAQLRLAQNRPADAIKELQRAAEIRPDSEAIQFQLARAFLASEDTARATTALERTLQLRPGFSPAALLLGQLHLRKGSRDEAVNTLRESIRQNPTFEPAYLQLARAYSSSGKLEDAFNALQVARSRFTNSFDSPLEQGLVLRLLGRPADAAQAFEAALRLSPTNHFAALEQLVLLDVAATNYARAHQRLQQRLASQPNEHLLWLVQCEVFLHQGNLAEAEKAARKATALAPESPTGLMSLARVLARSETRQKEAIQELDALLAKKPDNLEALVLSAGILQRGKDYTGASERYQRAIAGNPRNAYLHNNLAYLQSEHLKRPEEALATAKRARELAPEDPAIADTLGWIYYRQRNYDDALRYLLEASAKLGPQPEVQYHLGMAHYMMGHESEARIALSLANTATDEFPGRAEVRDYLAILDAQSSPADDQQLARLEQRRKEHPTDLIVLSRLGAAFESRGDVEKARAALEEALKVNPRSGPVLGRLATLYAERLNNPTRAAELIRTARTVAPSDPEVAYAAGRIALRAGDFVTASNALEEAARQFATRPEVTFDLARALLGQSRLAEAEASLLRIASTNTPLAPAARETLDLLKLVAEPSPSPQGAALVDRSLKKDPANPVALLAYAKLARAQGRRADAVKACEQILAASANWIPAVRELALVLADEPVDDARGFEAANRARRLLGSDDALTGALGKFTARKGDHRMAVLLLTEAARSQAGDASLQYHLGLAHEGMNQPAEARKAYQAAITAAPSARFAADARARLEALRDK